MNCKFCQSFVKQLAGSPPKNISSMYGPNLRNIEAIFHDFFVDIFIFLNQLGKKTNFLNQIKHNFEACSSLPMA